MNPMVNHFCPLFLINLIVFVNIPLSSSFVYNNCYLRSNRSIFTEKTKSPFHRHYSKAHSSSYLDDRFTDASPGIVPFLDTDSSIYLRTESVVNFDSACSKNLMKHSIILPPLQTLTYNTNTKHIISQQSPQADRMIPSYEPYQLNSIQWKPLVLMVVDISSPGGSRRIEAVKNAVIRLLPAAQVGVIACYYNAAEFILPPTTSLVEAARKLSGMEPHWSKKGNLAAGISQCLDFAVNLQPDTYNEIIIPIIADGRSHHQRVGQYDETIQDICDSAMTLSSKSLEILNKRHQNLKPFIVDTSIGSSCQNTNKYFIYRKSSNTDATTLCRTGYHLAPQLIGEQLVRMIHESI